MNELRPWIRISALVLFGSMLTTPGCTQFDSWKEKPSVETAATPAQSIQVKNEDDSDSLSADHKISARFPNILLYTQDNKPVRFYDDLVKDRIVVVNFMYTSCTGT